MPLCAQSLSLYGMDLCIVPDVQMFTASTASSHLKQLVISEGRRYQSVDTDPLPEGALKQMFSASKQWPFLHVGSGY